MKSQFISSKKAMINKSQLEIKISTTDFFFLLLQAPVQLCSVWFYSVPGSAMSSIFLHQPFLYRRGNRGTELRGSVQGHRGPTW